MMALEKDRMRRYQTAVAFADDIERFLRDEPVVARSPSTAYQLHKFIRKRLGWVAAAATITTILVIGVVGSCWFAIQANIARREALVEKERADYKAAEATQEKLRADQEAQRAVEAAALATKNERDATLAREQTETSLARSNFLVALARWDANRVTEAMDYLQRVPAPHRNLEWRVARRQFQGSDLTLYGHRGTHYRSGAVRSVSVRPDGQQIASAGGDNRIILWDSLTGAIAATLKHGDGYVYSLAFAPDGRRLLSCGSDKNITLWDTQTGKVLKVLRGHRDHVTCIAISPDSLRVVSGSSDSTVRLWNLETGEEIRRLEGHSHWVSEVAFSPNANRIVSSSFDGTIKLWDAASFELIATLDGHRDGVTCVAFSPQGDSIASGSRDATLKLWDAKTGEELGTLDSHSNEVTSVAFSPDGTCLASGSADNTIIVWDLFAREPIRSLRGHLDRVASLGFGPDGTRLVSGSDDKTLKIWDIAKIDNSATWSWQSLALCVALSSDGSQVAKGTVDGTVVVHDALTGEPISTVKGPGDRVDCVAICRIGNVLAAAGWDDDIIRLYDSATGEELLNLRGHTGRVDCVVFNPEGTLLASGSSDSTIKLWDANTGELRDTLRKDGASNLAFSPNGKQLLSSKNSATTLWDLNTREALWVADHTEGLTFSPDGTRVVSVRSGVVRVLGASDGETTLTIDGRTSRIKSAAFSPDGTRIVSASSDGVVKLWDSHTGEELYALNQNIRDETVQLLGTSKVAISDDATRITSWNAINTSGKAKQSVQVWETTHGEETNILSASTSRVVSCVTFSTDGTQIAAGDAAIVRPAQVDQGGSINVWDLASRKLVHRLNGFTGRVHDLAFSPDGTRIAGYGFTAFGPGEQRIAKVWDLSTGLELFRLGTLPFRNRGLPGRTIAFGDDGGEIYVREHDGSVIVWDPETGREELSETWPKTDSEEGLSPGGRWLAIPQANNVLLVDLHFKEKPREQAFRAAKARFKPWWHLRRALETSNERQWYPAVFHLALLMHHQPDRALSHDLLNVAYDELRAEVDSEQLGIGLFVPQFVSDAIAMPRGTDRRFEPLPVAKINKKLWAQVGGSNSGDASSTINRFDILLMREVCRQKSSTKYWRTLSVAEYRMQQYEEAAEAAQNAVALAAAADSPRVPNPIELAVLAMSHAQLGDIDSALTFRRHFEDIMSIDRHQSDNVANSLRGELAELLDPHATPSESQ